MGAAEGSLLVDFLIIAAGIVLILGLGEVVIRNAIDLAAYFHVSGTFIGLTILSVGTSVPEIFTHLVGSATILGDPASLDKISALVVGANIGSDIFQQNFILPLVGIVGVVIVRREELWSEIGALLGASTLLLLFSLGGVVSRLEGGVLVLAYLAYLLFLAKKNHIVEADRKTDGKGARRAGLALALIVLSFAVMAVVTDQVVGAASRLIEQLPISASFFGVIFLGIASALPELTTSLLSLMKGEKGIPAGVLIGSNITNPLLALGLGALVSTYTVPDVVVYYDLPVKIGTAAFLFVFLWTRAELAKWEAGVLISLFAAYIVFRDFLFPVDF